VAVGGTLDLGGTLGIGALNLGTEIITVSGAGVGGNGALVNNGSNDQINATGRIVLAGNTTFGGTRRWDLRSSGPTLNMAGFTITKEGTNQVSLVGTTVSNPGNVIINAGSFGFETTTNPGGNATNTVTVNAAGTLIFYGNTVVFPWSIALNNGTMTQNNTNATASGPVTLAAGTSAINVPATSLTLSGVLSGAGGFTKGAGGALILTNVNTYDGATTVAAGTLRVGVANAIPDGVGKGNVTVDGTLDVNGIAETINGLSGGGIVDNIPAAATTLSVGNGDANGTFTGTLRDTGGALTLRKIGAGAQTVSGTQDYATLVTEAGTMNVNSALGTGAATVNANGGTTNFGVSQTLAALNIGAGATVVLTAAPAPEGGEAAPAFGGPEGFGASFGDGVSSVAAVPEPGSAALIFGGALALLGIRRRRNA
jgi:autotransporter-associated beta strand protein